MAVGLPTLGHMALYKMCAAGRTGHPRSLSFIVILSPFFIVILSPFFIVILSEAKDPAIIKGPPGLPGGELTRRRNLPILKQ